MGSASTKLVLVSVQEPGVWENGSDVHPRSIYGIIHSITAAAHQQSSQPS